MTESDSQWRRCSACKKAIAYDERYWVCSVSTCNRSRTALFFCSVSCWEVHLPVARHREAWAEERRAPSREAVEREAATAATKPAGKTARRHLVRPQRGGSGGAGPGGNEAATREVLVIASRLKDYIRARSGMNTSDRVLEPISKIVREVCDDAIRSAQGEGRKTVLDRDVPPR